MYAQMMAACEQDACLSREQALQVLNPNLPAEVLTVVQQAADRRMRAVAGNRGRMYATIGVDSAPCPMNCRFCSHGAAWNLQQTQDELSPEQVCERLHSLLDQGTPDWFTLRTTQFYGIDRLQDLCARVRTILPDTTRLIVNTGEFTLAQAQALAEVGVNMSYHTFRLREGTDTGVSPAARLETLAIIRDSALDLAALVEPIGPEHGDLEIVDAAFLLKDHGVRLGGAMARVPVPGTPLAQQGQISEERHARVISMVRLISDDTLQDVCVHPPVPQALQAGANTVVVESGAVPRDTAASAETWRHFGIRDAVSLLGERDFQHHLRL